MGKKKSNYTPRLVLADPMGLVLGDTATVASAKEAYLTMLIRIHSTLTVMYQGKADKRDLDVVINAMNIAEALVCLGVGRAHVRRVMNAQKALSAIIVRGGASGVFLHGPEEWDALELGIEVHNAQMEVCRVSELETAGAIVRALLAAKRAKALHATGNQLHKTLDKLTA